MSSAQRLAVWNGEKKRTSGGLTKSDLTKNRHGKIVSKKKSEVARKLNNLGAYLANKGKKKVQEEKEEKSPKPKPKPKPKKKSPKPKPKPKKKLGPKKQKQSDIDKMLDDPEVAEKRKKMPPKSVSADVDVVNIRRSRRARKRVDYSKMGGRIKPSDLGGSLGKQLKVAKERAAKKPPRRARKKRKKKEKDLEVLY